MGNVTYKTSDDTKSGSVDKVLCNKCGHETNHTNLHSHTISGEEVLSREDGISIAWTDDYQIIKCAGCDSVSFRHTSWFSEDYDYDDDDPRPREILYPHRSRNGIKINEFPNLPPNLKRIYRETIDCINSESNTLAAAGLRALVEGFCAELDVSDGPVNKNGSIERSSNLEGKINGLAERRVLTEQGANGLHEHRFLGNEAIHELAQPSKEELKLAIELVEHAFRTAFDVPQMHTDLQSRRNSRSKRQDSQ